MDFAPVLAALKRYKVRVTLLLTQIALTMAIVCNALFIVAGHVERLGRATGMEEKNLFLVEQQRIGSSDVLSADASKSALLEDLAALRRSLYVESVTPINTLPLTGANFTTSEVMLEPGKKNSSADVVFYDGDEALLKVLGLKLVAGRSFEATDVTFQGTDQNVSSPSVIIITSALAKRLFPAGSALNKRLYFDGGSLPSTIIGIVDTLQAPSVEGWAEGFAWHSVLVPRVMVTGETRFALKAKPGELKEAMQDAMARLYGVSQLRVMGDQSIRSFSDIRDNAYRSDVGAAVVLGIVCFMLLLVAAGGVMGVTGSWVFQRRRQIGIRRALGARKRDILCYFMIENFVVTSVGVILGVILGIALNTYLKSQFELGALPTCYLAVGAASVIGVSSLAAYGSARRAAKILPAIAVRTI